MLPTSSEKGPLNLVTLHVGPELSAPDGQQISSTLAVDITTDHILDSCNSLSSCFIPRQHARSITPTRISVSVPSEESDRSTGAAFRYRYCTHLIGSIPYELSGSRRACTCSRNCATARCIYGRSCCSCFALHEISRSRWAFLTRLQPRPRYLLLEPR